MCVCSVLTSAQTLEKISEEFPSAIVREGGLGALLNYLDFFSIAVQRTALAAAANCCRNLAPEHADALAGVWPIIRGCLGYGDARLVESAALCVIRAVDALARGAVARLDVLLDTPLLRALSPLLAPAGGAALLPSGTFTQLLRALATGARTSPRVALALLEADVADILHHILAGVLPPASADAHAEEGAAATGQGLGGGLADMTVMENLAHRPKEQVEEALGLCSELMPALPRGRRRRAHDTISADGGSPDGVFDHKSYSEKALGRMVKAKAKADKEAARAAKAGTALPERVPTPQPEPEAPMKNEALSTESGSGDTPTRATTPTPERSSASASASAERAELLRTQPAAVNRFMTLMVPVLVDVYAASVIPSVRIKALTAVLKAVSFLDGDGLRRVLKVCFSSRPPCAGPR
jgi:E3 ubiquitin-protein ligase TRIP12